MNTWLDLYKPHRQLPKGHVLVTTTIDLICPSRILGATRPVRCTRGVGHEGRCRNGRQTWLMSEDERCLSGQILDQIVEEQRSGSARLGKR